MNRVHTFQLEVIQLIAPDYAAIRIYHLNHEVVTRYLVRLDDGTYLIIIRVQYGPGLRNVIRSIMDYPHVIILT